MKLLSRFAEQDANIETVLDQLTQDNLLSNQRFAESFVRYRYQNGYGKQRIRIELKQKGVSQALIEHSLDQEECDWFASALKLKISKYGPEVTKDFKTKAKQYRYLNNRGFSSDEIQYALQEET